MSSVAESRSIVTVMLSPAPAGRSHSRQAQRAGGYLVTPSDHSPALTVTEQRGFCVRSGWPRTLPSALDHATDAALSFRPTPEISHHVELQKSTSKTLDQPCSP